MEVKGGREGARVRKKEVKSNRMNWRKGSKGMEVKVENESLTEHEKGG